MYCTLKLGEICLIESLVWSLIVSAILTAVATFVVWIFTYDKRKQAAAGQQRLRPAVLSVAKRALFDADYVRASDVLQPLLLKGDAEAQRLLEVIQRRQREYVKAADLAKEGKFKEAMPMLLDLARNGDTDAQWLAGLILVNDRTYPHLNIQGIEWLAVAAARGSDLAQKEIVPLIDALSPLEASGVKDYVTSWVTQHDARKAADSVPSVSSSASRHNS